VLLAYAKVLGEREKGAVAVVNNPLPEGKKESFHLSGR